MVMNTEYLTRKEIMNSLVRTLADYGCGISAYGSATYGIATFTGFEISYKPNKDSDIDLMVIGKSTDIIRDLEGIFSLEGMEVELFEQGHVDVLVLRALIDGKRISLQCLDMSLYQELCFPTKNIIIVNKLLNSSKGRVGNTYHYPIFGFKQSQQYTSRIVPSAISHLISYPNAPNLSNGDFALTVFQDQILTQQDLIDIGQGEFRKSLVAKVNFEAQSIKADPIGLFRERVPYWSKEFHKFMRRRFSDE